MELKNGPLYRVRSFTAFALIGWTAILLSLVWINWDWMQDHTLEIARAEARASIDKDILYRGWNSSHGGVYVPITETTQPNPYLNVPERDVTTTTGRKLTLINPAYMTRQVYEKQEITGVRAHLTSLNPLNPNNKADAWEAQALNLFESGVTETNSVKLINGKEYMRLMRPFITQEDCLTCHAQQGYKVGDVLGGLSVSVPMSNYAGIAKSSALIIFVGYGTIWSLGLLGIYLTSKDLKKRFKEREELIISIEKNREQIRASEEKFSKIFQYSPAMVTLSSLEDGRYLDVNQKFLDTFGFSRGDVIGKASAELGVIGWETRELLKSELISSGRFTDVEISFRKKDGNEIICLYNGELIELEGKTFLLSLAQNITEEKHIQESLRENETLLLQAQQVANLGYYLLDIQSGIWTSSDILDGIFGIEKDHPKNVQSWADIVYPDEREDMVAYFANEVLRKKQTFDREYRIVRIKDQQVRWVHGMGELQFDAQENLIRMIGTIQDITERKVAEASLRESETLFRKMNENSPLGMHFYKLNNNNQLIFVDANPAADKLLGVDNSQFIGKTIEEAFPPLLQTEVVERYRDAAVKGIPWSTEQIIYEDRQIKGAFEVTAFQTTPENMVAVFVDITHRKHAEEALKKSEALYHDLVETSQDLIWECDAEGRYTYLNPAWEQVFGYKIEEMLGKKFSDFQSPEMAKRDQEEFTYLLHGHSVKSYETIHIGKSGREINLVFNAKFLLDTEGKVIGTLGTAYDITERKRNENENLEKTQELEVLFKISSHLRTAQTVEEMIPVVLEQMSQIFHSDANALILLDEDQVHFTYTLGDGLLAVNTGMQFDAENSISGYIMQTRRPYITLDYTNDSLRSRTIRDSERIGPAVLVPLQTESEFIGTLLCARAEDSSAGPFTTAEVNLLFAIGEMVGNALRRAKLYDDALSRLKRVQALHSIDMAINASMDSGIALKILIDKTLTLMNVDAAAVLLYNPYTHVLEYAAASGFRYKDIENAHLKLGEGFANIVITERRLIKIPDLMNAQYPIYKKMANKEGFVSCYVSPMIAKGQVCGVLEVYSRAPLKPNQEWLEFLEALGGQAAIAIDNARLFINLERSNLELSLAYDETIAGWSHALDLKDKDTEGHTLRVTAWTIELAKLAGLSDVEIMHIRRGTLLHDIGKMGIPDNILNKAGELTSEEWDIMRQHPQSAYNMIYPIEFLRPALDIPYCHHEKWDGTGYPRGLQNVQIPYAARLFAIVDVWDALTSDRSYRKAWSHKKTIAHIKSQSGKHFDTNVVDLFMKMIASREG